jgi:hypothetical protein
MTSLAIGPRTANPSWNWVGLGIAQEMCRYYEIAFFDQLSEIPPADVVLVVKQRPSHQLVAELRAKSVRFFFAPIDVYVEKVEIYSDAEMLRACDAVLIHSEALLPVLTPLCRRACLVEHDARYALRDLVPFQRDGFLLWIGGFQHIPYVLHWLQNNPPPLDVRLLTDLTNKSARIAAHFVAYRIGVSLKIGDGKINDWAVESWSEATQSELMMTCKAAVDIKGSGFNQATKPPTKAQQFIASGIPFGCNPGHPAVAYFRKHGFDIAKADNFSRLLSRDYWEETRTFAHLLTALTARDVVGQAYYRLFSGEPG